MVAEYEMGLYESLVTERLRHELSVFLDNQVLISPLNEGDVADRLSRHVGAALEQLLSDLPEDDRVQRSIEIANRLSPNKWCKSLWASTFSAPISSS